MFLVSLPLNECEDEVEVDLVLIQTSFLSLWKLYLKTLGSIRTALIPYTVIKQKGLYQTPPSFPSTTVTWATFPQSVNQKIKKSKIMQVKDYFIFLLALSCSSFYFYLIE